MFKLGFFSNPWLLLGVVLMVVAQLMFTYAPVMNQIFNTAPIGLDHWAIVIGACVAFYPFVELLKRQWRYTEKFRREIFRDLLDRLLAELRRNRKQVVCQF